MGSVSGSVIHTPDDPVVWYPSVSSVPSHPMLALAPINPPTANSNSPFGQSGHKPSTNWHFKELYHMEMGWVSQLSGGFQAPLFLCPSIVQFLLAFCHSSWVVGGWIVVLYAGAEPLQGDPVRLTPMSFIGGSYIIIHMQISLDLHPVSHHSILE
ncbi:hypothetical protein AOLI_G00242860 [Acnodon oligacanthus]